MKKVLCVVFLFIIFILTYFIQTNFFSWFRIAGIQPNLFIILALFIGLFMKEIYGVTIGATLGVLLDLFVGRVIRNKWYCTSISRFSRRKIKSEVYLKTVK